MLSSCLGEEVTTARVATVGSMLPCCSVGSGHTGRLLSMSVSSQCDYILRQQPSDMCSVSNIGRVSVDAISLYPSVSYTCHVRTATRGYTMFPHNCHQYQSVTLTHRQFYTGSSIASRAFRIQAKQRNKTHQRKDKYRDNYGNLCPPKNAVFDIQ